LYLINIVYKFGYVDPYISWVKRGLVIIMYFVSEYFHHGNGQL